MVTRSQILRNARYAGRVIRYHTWPMITSETVAGHTWQVLRLYTQIFGQPSSNVATYILWHDAGELVIGDLPFPVKARNPDLKAVCDRIEHEAVEAMGGVLPKLSDADKVRVKAVDLVDMIETGFDELAMGNTFAEPIVRDVRENLERLSMYSEDRRKIEAYLTKVGIMPWK